MYGEIEAQANLTGNESVVDAFCGTGTIGIWLSQNAKEVRGMDIIKEGIDDAKKMLNSIIVIMYTMKLVMHIKLWINGLKKALNQT